MLTFNYQLINMEADQQKADRVIDYCLIHPRNVTSNRCNSMLADFLQERSNRNLGNVPERGNEETTSDVRKFRNQVTLHDELFFKIFISLPVKSLLRIQLVCKIWLSLIRSSIFIKSHAHQSETVLICRELAISSQPFDDKPKSYFHFFDLHSSEDSFIKSSESALNHVLASCDGLVLGRSRTNNCLVLANPLTQKHVQLPSGKMNNSLLSDDEAYYLAFCKNAKTYKVVHLLRQKQVLHLFRQKPRYVDCEIMCMNSRTWKMVDGFPADLLQPMMHVQVSVDGSLYWKPRKQDCDYYVAMDLHVEKFITKKLPVVCNAKDRLLEFGGTVGLVTNTACRMIDIWILMKDKENWTNMHTINLNFEFRYSPSLFCSLRNEKDLVFEFPDQKTYIYDLDKGDMKLVSLRDDVETWYEGIEKLYLPHRNTLVSWENETS